MGLKKTGEDSKLFSAASGSAKPSSLADQDPTMGVHESAMRAQKQARKEAMQATKSPIRIDSEPKNTTGPMPQANPTTRGEDKRF